jgi:20S proteasome subunit alpha 5
MFMTRSEYDRGVNTFSPEGRLFQIEYAIEAIKLGSTAVGIQTAEGVVLAVEKRVTSPLLVSSSIEKVMEIDAHVGCAMSGLIADAKTLVDHARVQATHHTFNFEEPMPVEALTQSVCDLALQFGESQKGSKRHMSRPFGVALLVAGLDFEYVDSAEGDDNGPRPRRAVPVLFHTDPSGTFTQFSAKAIGSGAEGAQTMLQDEYNKSMTLEEAETLAAKVLKQVMEEKVTDENIEIAAVTARSERFEIYSKEQIEGILQRL